MWRVRGARYSIKYVQPSRSYSADARTAIATENIRVYRAALTQLRYFVDQHAAGILSNELKRAYINSSLQPAASRRAKQFVRLLTKANVGDLKALRSLLERAYGQRGRLRHVYLRPILAGLTEIAEPLIPGYPRSRPPVITQQLQAIWQNQSNIAAKMKFRSPELSVSATYKPLDKKREANARWAHYAKLLKKTIPPMPEEQYAVLRHLATTGTKLTKPNVAIPAWRKSLLATLDSTRHRKTTDAHQITSRVLKRLYLSVLHKSPRLELRENGSWTCTHHRPKHIDTQKQIAHLNELLLTDES